MHYRPLTHTHTPTSQHAARGWRSPPPPRREQRKEAPDVAAPGVEEGELETESVAEPEGEGMEE